MALYNFDGWRSNYCRIFILETLGAAGRISYPYGSMVLNSFDGWRSNCRRTLFKILGAAARISYPKRNMPLCSLDGWRSNYRRIFLLEIVGGAGRIRLAIRIS